MSVEAMSSLPMQAGTALAAAAGRTALWALSSYMRAPLRNSAVAGLVVLSGMAGANVLYRQAHHHPAPLFGSFAVQAATSKAPAKAKPAPIAPVSKPKALAQKVSTDTTGSIAHVTPGNDDVRAVQQQLKSMALFTGTVDGLFGPRTSKAIRAFETQAGRAPTGQLTPEIVALITGASPMPAATTNAAPTITEPTIAAPAATKPTIVAPSATVQLAVATPDADPLPAPAPLSAGKPVLSLSATTDDGEDETATAAIAPAETTDSTGTETLAMTSPPTVAKRSVPTIAVRASLAPAASQQMPATLALAPATETPDAEAVSTDTVNADVADAQPPAATLADPAMDTKTVTAVQRGLNSLGFLHGEISGEADEATAKAIRNFEVYYNYNVTGRVTGNLVKMLIQAGAVI